MDNRKKLATLAEAWDYHPDTRDGYDRYEHASLDFAIGVEYGPSNEPIAAYFSAAGTTYYSAHAPEDDVAEQVIRWLQQYNTGEKLTSVYHVES